MLIDMPVEKLLEYKGINPKPDDFDQYWEKALKEMNETDPQLKITEADFHAPGVKCYDLYFTGVHGARVYAKYLKPEKVNGKMPAVLNFHGYSGSSVDWSEYLSYVLAGYSVFALDCRGQGGKSEDVGGVLGNTLHGHIIRGLDDPDPHKLLFRDIFLDTAQLAKIAMSMDDVDEKRVGAWGGSQGGGLTIACASLVPQIKIACPQFPFLSDYKRVWEMDLAKDAYGEIQEYFRRFDPRHERHEQIFTKLGYIDIKNLAPRIKAKVTMFTGLMDTICPPSTQFAAYNNMTCEKEYKLYPDFGHERFPEQADIVYQIMMKL